MNTSIKSVKLATAGLLVAVCGGLYSSPSTAGTVIQSFYQNLGGTCHGIDWANDFKLTRTPQRLINDTTTSVTVVCNLMGNERAQQGAGTFDTIVWVTLWAHRTANRNDNKEMNCMLVTSFATDTPVPLAAAGQGIEQIGKTITLPSAAATLDQGKAEWYRPTADLKPYFRAPANITCIMPPKSQLHDANILYFEKDAS